MKKLKTSLQFQITVPLLIVLCVLAAAMVWIEYCIDFEKLEKEHLTTVRRSEWLMHKSAKNDADVYARLTDQICENSTFRQTFSRGDRQELLELSKPVFKNLNADYNVTHLYFYTPEKNCFLRVLQPGRLDDSIDRYTLAGADRLDRPYYGLEVSPVGILTLRYVRPWRIDGKLVGYVELGEEIQHVTADLQEIMNVDLAVVVNKSFVNRFDWQTGQRLMGRDDDWDLLEDGVVVYRSFEEVPIQFIDTIRRYGCLKHQSCQETLRLKIDDHHYICGCFDLKNTNGQSLGRMFIIKNVTAAAKAITQMSLFSGAVVIATGFFVLMIFYCYVGCIGKHLQETDRCQRVEILHRKFAEAQLKESAEQAEAANKAKSEFLSNMSHELRTPMNAIVGFSELLYEESLSEEQHDYVDTILSSSRHLLALINDVLDLSKIEAGKLEIVTEFCQIREMMSRIESMMRGHVESKGLAFVVDVDPAIPAEIVTDTRHLYQCLINLVGNAVKFTASGCVRLTVSPAEMDGTDGIRFEVQDSGIGIPEDRQKLIFEAFQQADSSTSRKYGGTGLGLAITRRLIHLMGGTLTVTSVEGDGSTFTIVLPLTASLAESV